MAEVTGNAAGVLQQVWIRAGRGEEVTLTFPDKATRTQVRFMLYNIAKQVKNGKGGLNVDLEYGVQNSMINTVGETQLVVRPRKLNPIIQGIAEQLGIDVESAIPFTEETQAAEESAERLKRILEQQAPGDEGQKVKNPYISDPRWKKD